MRNNNCDNQSKALVATTVASTIDQFCMNDIKLLRQQYNVHVAANFDFGNNTSDERIAQFKGELAQKDVQIHEMRYSRNPLHKSNVAEYKRIKQIIDENDYKIIHCHTPVAAMIVRLAARKARKSGTKIIYTAHGFHFYKGAPLINWLLYYPMERFLARYTDVLVAINQEDYQRAKSSFKAKKTACIPGVGIDISRFSTELVNKKQKRNSLGIPEDGFLVLSVGELNKNKNHEVVIRALAKLQDINIHYIICGQGKEEPRLRALLHELDLEGRVHLLGYRKDVSEIYKIADLFVFPSYREGLSVALMEAMASGLPVICSDIRGNNDLIDEGHGGYLIKPFDVESFKVTIKDMYKNDELRYKFGITNKAKVVQFSIQNVSASMEKIYDEIIKLLM